MNPLRVSKTFEKVASAETVEIENLLKLSDFITKNSWCPAIFKGSETHKLVHRSKSNFISTDLLVLDIDDGHTLKQAEETFEGFAYIIATTKSHQKLKNNLIVDRFRVVLLLDRTCTLESEYNATWKDAYELWTFIDKSCKDSSRFYFACDSVYKISEGVSFPVAAETKKVIISKTFSRDANIIPAIVTFLQLFGVQKGGRNVTIFKAACEITRCGYSVDEIYDFLRHTTDLDELEFVNCINSAYKCAINEVSK